MGNKKESFIDKYEFWLDALVYLLFFGSIFLWSYYANYMSLLWWLGIAGTIILGLLIFFEKQLNAWADKTLDEDDQEDLKGKEKKSEQSVKTVNVTSKKRKEIKQPIINKIPKKENSNSKSIPSISKIEESLFNNIPIKWIYIFVPVIFILYFIGSYNGNNGSSNNTRYSSSEKGIIEVCESFSADLKLDFKGSPSECYKFLNSYKNSLNREVNNLLPVLALAISSTNNSNMLVLVNQAKNSLRTDCKNKTLNKSHGREYLVKCMVDMQLMPDNLIKFIKITNSHAQMKKARQIRIDTANRMISSGLSLMGGNTKKSKTISPTPEIIPFEDRRMQCTKTTDMFYTCRAGSERTNCFVGQPRCKNGMKFSTPNNESMRIGRNNCRFTSMGTFMCN